MFIMLASLAAAGLLGVGVLVLDHKSVRVPTPRVIVTALPLALLGITALVSAWIWEQGRRRSLVLTGMIIAAATFLLTVYMIWADPPWPEIKIEARLMCTGIFWTACLLILSSLALARLRRPWRALNTATQAMLVVLALMATLALNYELDDDLFLRLIGGLVVLGACGTVSVPLLHRLNALSEKQAVTTALVLQIVCPRCGKPQALAAGHSRCRACGLRLYIEIEEERCAKCGYVLYQLTSDRCPECGTPVAVMAGDKVVRTADPT
jgi:hypothetical protein